jgi:hypothetical protein
MKLGQKKIANFEVIYHQVKFGSVWILEKLWNIKEKTLPFAGPGPLQQFQPTSDGIRPEAHPPTHESTWHTGWILLCAHLGAIPTPTMQHHHIPTRLQFTAPPTDSGRRPWFMPPCPTCTPRPYPCATECQAKFSFSSGCRAQSVPLLCSSRSTAVLPCRCVKELPAATL